MSFAMVWAMGPRVIRLLLRLKIGDQASFNHAQLDEMMKAKRNTPTMGGVMIVAGGRRDGCAARESIRVLRADGVGVSGVARRAGRV